MHNNEQASTPRSQGGKFSYKEKHQQMNREALATFIAAALVMVFWWAAGFGLSRLDITLFKMPAWFVLGSAGSWLLSIALVVVLLKRVFRNFSLDDESEES